MNIRSMIKHVAAITTRSACFSPRWPAQSPPWPRIPSPRPPWTGPQSRSRSWTTCTRPGTRETTSSTTTCRRTPATTTTISPGYGPTSTTASPYPCPRPRHAPRWQSRTRTQAMTSWSATWTGIRPFPGMMVATAPTDGYRSVGVAPVMTGKANATPTTDELETSANIAPLTTMDGVNEKGCRRRSCRSTAGRRPTTASTPTGFGPDRRSLPTNDDPSISPSSPSSNS